MKKILTFLLTCSMLLTLVTGCRSARVAAGPRRALDVLIEEGKPGEMEERQYRYRTEVRDYMQRELPRRFARYGIDARMIRDRGGYAPEGGRHLLVVKYLSYNPGSSAARIVVGFGAGAASLNIQASLYDGQQEILSWQDGCGTSGHWSRLVNKLDANMGARLREFYSQR